MDLKTEHGLWVEEFRPKNLDEYIGNEHLKEKFTQYIQTGDVPHLLLGGEAGTGKTSIAKILVNTIDCDYLYINASDENSVDIVRDKIKSFASSIGFKDIKIVILDEADFITLQAQAALRNILETYSKTTRFILTCNYIEKILPAIQSRCQTFIVEPPSKKGVAIHVAGILDKKGVKYEPTDIAEIVNSQFPDLRKIINECQNFTIGNKLIIPKNAIIQNNYFTAVLDVINNPDIKKAKKIEEVRKIFADNRIKDFTPFYRYLYENLEKITEDQNKKGIILLTLADYHYKDSFVVDHELNMAACMLSIISEL